MECAKPRVNFEASWKRLEKILFLTNWCKIWILSAPLTLTLPWKFERSFFKSIVYRFLFISKEILFFSVFDASGRYPSQFHFGNGFWLGSSTLCKELNATNNKIHRELDDAPPYPLKFHVARMYLTLPKELELSVSISHSSLELFNFFLEFLFDQIDGEFKLFSSDYCCGEI